jgi:glutaredoxin 2
LYFEREKHGVLPEFRTTKAMQKWTAKKHLMKGEKFGEAIVVGFGFGALL